MTTSRSERRTLVSMASLRGIAVVALLVASCGARTDIGLPVSDAGEAAEGGALMASGGVVGASMGAGGRAAIASGGTTAQPRGSVSTGGTSSAGGVSAAGARAASGGTVAAGRRRRGCGVRCRAKLLRSGGAVHHVRKSRLLRRHQLRARTGDRLLDVRDLRPRSAVRRRLDPQVLHAAHGDAVTTTIPNKFTRVHIRTHGKRVRFAACRFFPSVFTRHASPVRTRTRRRVVRTYNAKRGHDGGKGRTFLSPAERRRPAHVRRRGGSSRLR